MLLEAQTFVITIGNYGTVVALHQGKEIKHKIFLESLTDDLKADLKKLFNKHRAAQVYMMLDTIDQSYKKKIYPSLKKSDLHRVIKRDMANDGNKESIKNYIILSNPKSATSKRAGGGRWECMFVSSSSSDITNSWIEFLLEMPNRLVGIYMLPLESFQIYKLLKRSIKKFSKIKNKKNDLCCIIIQNKVSGIRQVVFSDQGIVFTRVVNYNFQERDFLEKYEQDLYSTFEYLKRLYPDLKMPELDIVNIFPKEILDIIKNSKAFDFSFINYTPYEASEEIGYKNLIPKNSIYCDLLISKIFSRTKKVLKFATPRINFLERFFSILRISYYLNLFLLVTFFSIIYYIIHFEDRVGELISAAQAEKLSASQEMSKIKTSALDIDGEKLVENGNELDVDRVVDFGKLSENIQYSGPSIKNLYLKLKFIKNFDVLLDGFEFSMAQYNHLSPVPVSNCKISFSGKLSNKTGDIEDLFREFDLFTNQAKKTFEGSDIRYSELPRDINFTEKHYSFPIDFTITK